MAWQRGVNYALLSIAGVFVADNVDTDNEVPFKVSGSASYLSAVERLGWESETFAAQQHKRQTCRVPRSVHMQWAIASIFIIASAFTSHSPNDLTYGNPGSSASPNPQQSVRVMFTTHYAI